MPNTLASCVWLDFFRSFCGNDKKNKEKSHGVIRYTGIANSYIANNCNLCTKQYIEPNTFILPSIVIGRIISSLILVYIWIRAIRKIHIDRSNQLIITGLIFLANGLMIASILRSKSRLQNPTRNISIISILIFFGLINSLRYSGRKNIKKILGPRSLVGSLVIVLSIAGHIRSGLGIVVSYIVMSTCIEEVSKSTLIDLIPTHNVRNLIFHASLIGLAFSIIENIIYQLQRQSDARLRIRTTSVIHIICSAGILYLTLLLRNKTSQTRAIVGGLAGGIVLHSLYNRSLVSGYSIITICILIGVYPLLSYLLYQSDIIYNNQ